MAFAIGWLRYRPRYGDRDCESRGAVDPSAALLIWPSNPFRLWPVSVLVRWAVVRSATFHGPLMMIEILITRLELKAAPKQYEIGVGRQTDTPLEGFFLEWTPMHARAHDLNLMFPTQEDLFLGRICHSFSHLPRLTSEGTIN